MRIWHFIGVDRVRSRGIGGRVVAMAEAKSRCYDWSTTAEGGGQSVARDWPTNTARFSAFALESRLLHLASPVVINAAIIEDLQTALDEIPAVYADLTGAIPVNDD